MKAREGWGIVSTFVALGFLDLGAWMVAHVGKSGSPRHAEHLLIGISGAEIIILGIIGVVLGVVSVFVED
jgi:hypothetical protein